MEPTSTKVKIRYPGNTSQHPDVSIKPTDVLHSILRPSDRSRYQHAHAVVDTTATLLTGQAESSDLVAIVISDNFIFKMTPYDHLSFQMNPTC